MKKFYTKRFSLICAFAASALLLGGGCSEDETEPAIGSKGVSSEVFVSSDAGSRTIKVETSGPWQARLTPETRLWVSVDGADSGETGGSLNLNYRTNNSLPRKGTILVSSARQQVVDTIYLMQYGTTPLLEFKYIGKQYSSVSTIDSVAIDTNIPLSKKIYWTVVYDENSAAEPWADSVSYAQDFKYFRFRIADNKKFEPRTARFRLRFQDDWGEDHTTYFTAYQGIPGGTAETREMTFEELRGLIAEAEGEITLDQDIAVSGTVISDWASPNMAGSPMPKAAEKPDLGINDCTAYMQNADASLGLALVTTDAQQNNLQRYDKLKLWCKGLTLTKRSNPERYTLSGVTQDHIVTKEAGTAEELPAKRRFIDQLTDADIYTQVTLKRCQMAVRTGRFIPVHINYTNSFNNYYPAAVLDRHGDMIYLMTNHGCDWRFKEMPDGEGTITGIIVHEPYTFFERGGDIGRYQIRNVTREDIALDESADNVFSAVAVEWSPDGSKDPRAYAFPQYPHPATDSGQAHCVAATTGSGLSFMSTYAWLAVGSAYRAAENGLTINNASWGHKQLWDTAKNTGNSLIFEFSTQGVSSTQCSFVFTCRYHSAQGGLRYWTAEYSLDGDNWKKLTDFTVPDNGNWGNMQLEQLSGDKNVWMQVPTEILGQSVAWIRLRPVQNKIGTATTYDTATIASNGQVANAFTEESLTALAGRYGHPYAILCKESGFPVGLTSKYPIELRNRLLEDVPLWHGAIHTRIKDINVVVLHLYPFGTYPNGQGAAGTGNTYRDREINCILDSTIRRYPVEPLWLMAGDFNSYSPKDADAMPANTYFETHSIVLKSGYCDALRDRHSQFFHTVPTPYNGESTADQRRIDFIYASQAVMREITDSRIIYDEFTATHSDHYPVMIEFRHYPSGKQASGVALK